jgi:hypothetical protein
LSVNSLLVRFFLAYLALVIGTVVALNFFEIKNPDICIGVFTAITAWGFALVNWLCVSFGKRNGRYLKQPEKLLTVIGISIVFLAMQVTLLFIPPFSNSLPSLSSHSLLGLAIMVVAEVATIYYIVNSVKNSE